VSALIPYARNSRTHSDEQVAQIAASIREFGFTNPVLIDADSGIIAGHGRVMAARKLGMDAVPCLRLGHLSDTQKRAYIIADNKLALNSGWDAEALQIELAELDGAGFKLDLTGFDGDGLTRAMFGDLSIDSEDAKYGNDVKSEIESNAEIKDRSALNDEKYTTKIQPPIYEVKGEKPELADLYDLQKVNTLTQEIQESSTPAAIKQFLMAAAYRHTVFNYEKIAEYYAHAPKELQQMMEKSALVIIDFDAAIEGGYVKLSKQLMQLSGESADAE